LGDLSGDRIEPNIRLILNIKVVWETTGREETHTGRAGLIQQKARKLLAPEEE